MIPMTMFVATAGGRWQVVLVVVEGVRVVVVCSRGGQSDGTDGQEGGGARTRGLLRR